MAWFYVTVAGVCEVLFTFCLGKAKTAVYAEKYFWYIAFAVALGASMGLLVKATQALPVSTAYAVWTGIGAAGTVFVGIFVFKDPATPLRVCFLVTLIGSIIGLKSVS